MLVLDGLALLVTTRLLGRIAPRLGENHMILAGALLMGGAYLLVLVVANWRPVGTERSSSRAVSRSGFSESPPRDLRLLRRPPRHFTRRPAA